MVASDSFAEFLREQLAPLGRVTMRRRMFGATGVFCNGLMFGGGVGGHALLSG
jgi:DNA transformation protein and related proteins